MWTILDLLFVRCINRTLVKEARVRFRVQVLVPVRYGGTTILKKIGYGYGENICFIKFFLYIIMHINFIY
jgi:hypothetical protein